uniref:C2H2-type domain-containing protein n=1 Tax=Glossina pallidipes TaxID=7398 RepID=A0A1A9ZED4_GLOPL
MSAAKRTKYATLTTTANVKEEIVPVLIHDPNSGEEPQYAYATFATTDEDEVAVTTLDDQHGHQEIVDAQEVIIDEHGRAVTIHQLVTEDGSSVEAVETVEDVDGTHTIVHIVPSTSSPLGDEGGSQDESIGSAADEEYEITENNSGDLGLRTGNKTFYCPKCNNCYSAAGSLKLHMRACMRQKPEVPEEDRKCTICNKVFNSASYMKMHMLRHSGVGPKRCQRCYRKFLDEEKFNAHMEQHKQQDKLEAEAEALAVQHGGKKVVVKEFNCSFCSQNFTVVFESGQVKRRYACDPCREKYSNAEMLKQHKQMVEEKREFHCERCGRKFVFEGFLQRHLPTCDGTIKRRRDMNRDK